MVHNKHVDKDLQYTINELLDDGVWPREIIDLLKTFVISGNNLDEVVDYIINIYCEGNLNNPHVPAFSMRQVTDNDIP